MLTFGSSLPVCYWIQVVLTLLTFRASLLVCYRIQVVGEVFALFTSYLMFSGLVLDILLHLNYFTRDLNKVTMDERKISLSKESLKQDCVDLV